MSMRSLTATRGPTPGVLSVTIHVATADSLFRRFRRWTAWARGPRRWRGHVAVYAVGDLALLAVLGDDELDVDDLRLESQPALDRIHAILAGQSAG